MYAGWGIVLCFPDDGLGQGPKAFPLYWLLLSGQNLS